MLTSASWNVRTLLDNSKADRPERRTALVARELARYKVDIAALSETRLADKGQLTETGGGYTFFWCGRSSEERREAGVGFAIKTAHVLKLASIPEGLNDRLMKMQLSLGHKTNATLISAYAPTVTNPDEIKDRFYEELDSLISSVPQSEKLIVLGDFNARVGTDHQAWHNIIGKHGVGKCNSNGLLLLRTCATHDLAITNTMFRLPTRNKTSLCGADCWTDHRLIISRLNFFIQPKRRPQGQKVAKKLNTTKLKCPQTAQELQLNLDSKLKDLQLDHDSVEEKWASFRDAVHSAALEVLGPATRHHQDWFDENDSEIHALLEEKNRLLRDHQNDPSCTAKKAAFTNMRSKVQSKLRSMQDSWLSTKAEEIQGYADRQDTRRFYNALKAVYGPQPSGSSPLLSADRSALLTDKKQILERWADHFNSVLNRPAAINDEAIARLPQLAINQELDVPPSNEEVNKAIKQMTSGKAPGPDAIPAELYKMGGEAISSQLTSLFQTTWNQVLLPQELKDATIVHIYRRKGNRQSCDNHRGISLRSIAGKILARVLLNRLLDHQEQGHLPESQCGFRAGRGTSDMIFAARQLQEKCMEQHRDLYTTFVDLTKAFDTVSREGLWKIMEKFGCPSTFIAIVRQFHDGMMARVLDDGEPSEAFPVTNGVKQGCVLAPTLFSMMFSAMLTDAFRDYEPGINIKFRTDGKLFNPRRLQAVTKVKETVLRDFLFADDCALNASDEHEMQVEMDSLSAACNNFGLTISTKKTEVMFQPAPVNQYHEPQISVNGQTLQAVETFIYLGSTLSRTTTIDAEINNRISKASSAFGRLREKVWERRGISLETKLKVYRAVVLTTLLYGSETWTAYRRHEKQLNHFHLRCLRNRLHIRWQDKVPDTEVLKQANFPSIITTMRKAQLSWAGHVSPMPDDRIPKQPLYGELCHGKRTVGGQRKRFKDSLKVSLKDFNISTESWESLASDRPRWRHLITKGANTAEERRSLQAEQKRAARKARATSTNSTTPTHFCPTCGRGFLARIGLISHLRTHRSSSTT